MSDLGLTQLKNIAEPVHVYSLEVGQPAQTKPTPPAPTALPPRGRTLSRWPALAGALAILAVVAAAYAWHAGLAPRLPGISVADDKLANAPRFSIAVLPFENLSSDPEQEYFADGITDDLTTDLSHLPESFVIARNTAFTYKGRSVDAKEIGKALGVRYALEGSVRRVGEVVEINAQLISTETGAHVWADRFEGELSKLGTLQFQVVARLAHSLQVELIRAESLRAMRERPNNPEAMDLVLHGAAVLMSNNVNNSACNEAITLNERALVLDPQNVIAKVDLAIA